MFLPSSYTRAFSFSKVNPDTWEYLMLIRFCDRIDAALRYKTIKDSRGILRLVGYFYLRGRPSSTDEVCGFLPNFLVCPLRDTDGTFDDFLARFRCRVDGPLFTNWRENPGEVVRRTLFVDEK